MIWFARRNDIHSIKYNPCVRGHGQRQIHRRDLLARGLLHVAGPKNHTHTHSHNSVVDHLNASKLDFKENFSVYKKIMYGNGGGMGGGRSGFDPYGGGK